MECSGEKSLGDWRPGCITGRQRVFFGRNSNIDDFEAEALPHWNDLYRTALHQLKDQALAEDVLQEAYLKAWKSFHQFRKGTDCRAWLFRIMFNCIHDHHRQWFNTKTVSEPEDAMEAHFPYAPPVPDKLTDEDIVAAVRGLAANYREVLLLADVEEFSYKEIAEVLNLPMGTVMSRLSRGRKQLRTTLAGVAESYGIGRSSSGGVQ